MEVLQNSCSKFISAAALSALSGLMILSTCERTLAQPPLPGQKVITVEVKPGPARSLHDSFVPVEPDAEISSPSDSKPRPPVQMVPAMYAATGEPRGPTRYVMPPFMAPRDPRTPWSKPDGGIGYGIEDKIEYPPGKKLWLRIDDTNEFSHVARLER